MGYYNTKKGIKEYIKRSEDWDGTKLIKILKNTYQKNLLYLSLELVLGEILTFSKKLTQLQVLIVRKFF